MFEPNATISVKEASTITGYHPVTQEPIYSSTETTLSLSVEESSRPAITNFPGVDESAIFLVGRLCSPSTLPDSVRALDVVIMEYTKSETQTLTGEFRPYPTGQSRLQLDGFFGEYVAGFFQVKTTTV